MDPLTLLKASAPGILSFLGGERGNIASAKEAQKNRDFQERMSSTSHQREVADLRAAGLNPILSATGGVGASTPSGSMAQQSDTITPAVSSAYQSSVQAAQIDNIKMDTYKKNQEGAESASRRWNNIQTMEILKNNTITTAFDAFLKEKALDAGKLSAEGYSKMWQAFLDATKTNSAIQLMMTPQIKTPNPTPIKPSSKKSREKPLKLKRKKRKH